MRRLAHQMHRIARRKGEQAAEEMKETYAKLIQVAKASRAQAREVCAALRKQAEETAQQLVEQFERFLPMMDQAIEQAKRRVIDGEVVPAAEKLLSLFEPHTQIIVRHKAGKTVEFGRKVFLDEVDGGIISRYGILKEVAPDDKQLEASLRAHQQHFGRPPPICWRVTEGATRRETKSWPRKPGSSVSFCQRRVASRRNGRSTRSNAGFGVVCAFALGAKDASVC